MRPIDHERVSPRQIQLRAQPPRLCRKLARMRSVTMGAKDGLKGLRSAICPFPSAFQQSNTVCDTARTVSLPTGRDYLPAQKKCHKQSSFQRKECRLLQPLLPRTQKRRELSAYIRSTCVKQSTHAATVQNVDPTQACAVYKAKRLVITIDLKDAYFLVPIHRIHRIYLRFAFGGIAYQFNALPFGLSLAPRVFTKCVEAAITPLRLRCLRVYNYLDDWLVAAHSEAAAVQDGRLVVAHLYRLGFVITGKKAFCAQSKLRIS